MTKHRRRRIPRLRFAKFRDIGWHVSIRDPETKAPRRIRFGNIDKAEAEVMYHAWLAEHLHIGNGGSAQVKPPQQVEKVKKTPIDNIVPGSLLNVANQIFKHDESRTRKPGDDRARGTLDESVAADRKTQLHDFIKFLNKKHSHGAVGRMRLVDLAMSDVEDFNRAIVAQGLSASQVSKRLQIIKALIDRAGRPENGLQRLEWNWDSRDVLHGKPTKKRKLPTVEQLKKILGKCDPREHAMVWMAIGLGFGQSDLAAVIVGQIDAKSYDLRRGKTGIERFGETPPLVWKSITEYLRLTPRATGEPLFVTRLGHPLTHGNGDAVQQWWYKLRIRIKETPKSLDGFYVLRHLGATEFGSRPNCSIGDIKRWLGHAASSHVADLYMKPVSPEYRPVVEWVRRALLTGRVDLRPPRK